ncbi:FadR/GntR family transcriptional regulator [Rhodovulum sp. DZ06]|uniref:FadR/GntR family transcriptional regulator n=1 Tax=Rhodovulum sp. DZ06 TaxID=3425126 RepID=UPI003D342D8F
MTTQDAAEGPPPEIAPIIAAVRGLAAEGRLPAERRLAEQLSVSRHQLRRALIWMRENEEIAAPRRRGKAAAAGAGAISQMVRNTNPVEVVELRIMIEPTLARLAALRATPAQIAAMRKAAEDIARRGAGAADLHRMIAGASGNTLAGEFYDMLRRIEFDARLRLDTGLSNPAESDGDEHARIVEAIAARDPAAAEKAMRDHLTTVHRLATMGPL